MTELLERGVSAVVKRFSKFIIAKAGMAWCKADVCR